VLIFGSSVKPVIYYGPLNRSRYNDLPTIFLGNEIKVEVLISEVSLGI
jgi:hypothetical protein